MTTTEFTKHVGISKSTANWVYERLNPDVEKGARKNFGQKEIDYVISRKLENYNGNIKKVVWYDCDCGEHYVTDTGKIYSNRRGFLEEVKGTNEDGSIYVNFIKQRGYPIRVPRSVLVANAWLPNPTKSTALTYIGEYGDDNVSNLKWVDF